MTLRRLLPISQVRRVQRRAIHLARRPTAARRPLPDFLLIGAMRAGSSALYRYLATSPDVDAAVRKEVHYFSLEFDRPLGWYRAHFPLTGAGRITGEATPYYLCHPQAPERAHAVVPDARLIAVLRDPVARAFSHYQHERRKGREPLALQDALDAEPDRLAHSSWDDPNGSSRRHSYLRRGHYADQLHAWLQVFDREQLLVVQSEELFAQPERVTRDVLDWLGARPPATLDLRPHNVGGHTDAMEPRVRRRLSEYFAPHNEDLYALLGRRFDWVAPPRG